MANRPTTIKQAEVTRLVKGAQAAGLVVERIEADRLTGKIIIYSKSAGGDRRANPWDDIE